SCMCLRVSRSKMGSVFSTTLFATCSTTATTSSSSGTPSQPGIPVAGVQKGVRQHSSPVPLRHTSPNGFCQLFTSPVWADTAPEAVAAAKASASAILEGLFMFLLVELMLLSDRSEPPPHIKITEPV